MSKIKPLNYIQVNLASLPVPSLFVPLTTKCDPPFFKFVFHLFYLFSKIQINTNLQLRILGKGYHALKVFVPCFSHFIYILDFSLALRRDYTDQLLNFIPRCEWQMVCCSFALHFSYYGWDWADSHLNRIICISFCIKHWFSNCGWFWSLGTSGNIQTHFVLSRREGSTTGISQMRVSHDKGLAAWKRQ